LLANRRELLEGMAGVFHRQALEKAEKEFNLYRVQEMKLLESDFDRAIKQLTKTDKTTSSKNLTNKE
jgi:hypothetical protein